VSDTDADGLLNAVKQFAADAEAWIKANHPTLTRTTGMSLVLLCREVRAALRCGAKDARKIARTHDAAKP
jgi:hypothetical protein